MPPRRAIPGRPLRHHQPLTQQRLSPGPSLWRASITLQGRQAPAKEVATPSADLTSAGPRRTPTARTSALRFPSVSRARSRRLGGCVGLVAGRPPRWSPGSCVDPHPRSLDSSALPSLARARYRRGRAELLRAGQSPLEPRLTTAPGGPHAEGEPHHKGGQPPSMRAIHRAPRPQPGPTRAVTEVNK